jgi:tRNA (guanosine-2'-O-)-methyltransferase
VIPRFPHADPLLVNGCAYPVDEIVARLAPLLTEERRARIEQVVAGRTYSVVPVLEGVHDLGNVNAVLRSAEGLGFGAAHLVNLQGDAGAWAASRATGTPLAGTVRPARRQSQGADKWVDLDLWREPAAAVDQLRQRGYRVVATHLSADAVPIEAVDFRTPTALVLGNEREGVSGELLAAADLNCVLPIDGFIQSYNISVAAALALYHARADRLARQGFHGDLDDEQRRVLTAAFYLRSVRQPGILLAR